MYFPFLRGKQFELIALRDISNKMKEFKDKISPIIEPVKESSTLKSTLKILAANDINFNVVLNPTVGDLQDNPSKIIEILNIELKNYSNYQVAIIIEEKTTPTAILKLLKESALNYKGITFIHYASREGINDFISSKTTDFTIINNIIHYGVIKNKRYYREFEASTLVSLDDFFKAQLRNADFLNIDDSAFSEEHLFFSKDGFKGFSDFLTIGENYSEAGFLPRAVAIHLSYMDSSNKMRVKHFVSDSNEDTADIAGKFAEALNKLIIWNTSEGKMNTIATDKFSELHKTGHFPGLGTLKKLSAMHHIEILLNNF
jgi:hypothetical protein